MQPVDAIRRRRPSPALVISTISLFVALTGTAIAANTISSRDIINGEVKTPDLATGAVTAGKIANGHVRVADLDRDSVVSSRIRNGQVRSADVANGSLGPADLAPGALGSGPAWLAKDQSVELTGETKVMEVDLPAGSFTFSAHTVLDNHDGDAVSFECAAISFNGGTLVETYGEIADGTTIDGFHPVGLGGAFTQSSPGSLSLFCSLPDGDAEEARLVVTEVAEIR